MEEVTMERIKEGSLHKLEVGRPGPTLKKERKKKRQTLTKKQILHFNLSVRIVLIRSHHLNMNSLCHGIVRQRERMVFIK